MTRLGCERRGGAMAWHDVARAVSAEEEGAQGCCVQRGGRPGVMSVSREEG